MLSMVPKPIKVSIVDQYKYGPEKEWPLWKRLLFRYIWCTLIEFGLEKLQFAQWDTKDARGNYSYREFQGVFSEPWLAAQEAGRYEHAFTQEHIVNESQPKQGILAPAFHPHAVTNAYERINRSTVHYPIADANRLRQKLIETSPV